MQILSDTQVRISRIVRGSLESVWRAHQEPTLLFQWLLGHDGWTMPVCEAATEVGQTVRGSTLATGMTDGMETSYTRLESLIN